MLRLFLSQHEQINSESDFSNDQLSNLTQLATLHCFKKLETISKDFLDTIFFLLKAKKFRFVLILHCIVAIVLQIQFTYVLLNVRDKLLNKGQSYMIKL